MDNFKFNFLARGQLGSLSIDNLCFFYSKCYHAMSIFFGNFIFPLIARTLSGNRLKMPLALYVSTFLQQPARPMHDVAWLRDVNCERS